MCSNVHLAQLWRYYEATMLLESKSGNWKHLPEKWVQLPKYDEDAACIEAFKNKTLEIVETKVELQTRGHSSCQKWKRSKAVEGYFALITEDNLTFLTVEDTDHLTIHGTLRHF